MAEIRELGSLPINRGKYVPTEEYFKDNVVQYNYCSYICKVAGPLVNSVPSIDNPNWDLFSGIETIVGDDENRVLGENATKELINDSLNTSINFTQIVAEELRDESKKNANEALDDSINFTQIVKEETLEIIDNLDDSKQDVLTAGTNITINGNIISAKDTTYNNATTSNAGLMSSNDKSKLDGIASGAQVNTVNSVAGKTGAVTLNSSDVGLGNVNNTSDANKPISNAVQTALNTKTNNTDFQSHINNIDMHIPSGGKRGQWLTVNSNGQLEWVDMNMADLMGYGVEWDITQSTPICTRIGNPLLHKSLPIQNSFRGCVHNSGVVNYYLDANNWAYKEDGTTKSVLNGDDGNVGVDIGRDFYGKSFILGNKRRVYVSTIPIDSTWTKIPRMIIDAYRPTVDNTTTNTPKMASVVNTTAEFRGGGNREAFDEYKTTDAFRTDLGKPRTSISRGTMRNYALNAGGALLPYEYYKWVFYWLYVIEYANFNCQATYNSQLTADGYKQGGLGAGVTNWSVANNTWTGYNGNYPLTPCGYTNGFGNFTGIKDLVIPASTATDGTTAIATKTLSVPRWRGFENPFGNVWTNMDQVIIQNDQSEKDSEDNYLYKNVYTLKNPERIFDITTKAELDALKLDTLPNDNFKLIGRETNVEGYNKEFTLGDNGDIIPSECGNGASDTKYKCDYHWAGNKQDTSVRTLVFGGGANADSTAGLGYFTSGHGVGHISANIGFRGCYKYKE